MQPSVNSSLNTKSIRKIDGNIEYPNSAIGYLSPNEFEKTEKLKAVA